MSHVNRRTPNQGQSTPSNLLVERRQPGSLRLRILVNYAMIRRLNPAQQDPVHRTRSGSPRKSKRTRQPQQAPPQRISRR